MQVNINGKQLDLPERIVGAIGLLVGCAEEIDSFKTGHVKIDFSRSQTSLSIHPHRHAVVPMGKRLPSEFELLLLDKQAV